MAASLKSEPKPTTVARPLPILHLSGHRRIADRGNRLAALDFAGHLQVQRRAGPGPAASGADLGAVRHPRDWNVSPAARAGDWRLTPAGRANRRSTPGRLAANTRAALRRTGSDTDTFGQMTTSPSAVNGNASVDREIMLPTRGIHCSNMPYPAPDLSSANAPVNSGTWEIWRSTTTCGSGRCNAGTGNAKRCQASTPAAAIVPPARAGT